MTPAPAPAATELQSHLKALHSPRRREILRLCWRDPLTAGAIAAALPDVTFGAVSQHLRLLREAGLVAVTKRGRERVYAARRTAVGPLRRWLEASWDGALYRLKLRAELEAARRGPLPDRDRGTP
ncbi:MAG: winged helix-turn-helix transcriptional regulator [Planctomycetes bacterium]|nr:winged helix-turn-helix transcriptional regulator [Planctomycetota bacterium]